MACSRKGWRELAPGHWCPAKPGGSLGNHTALKCQGQDRGQEAAAAGVGTGSRAAQAQMLPQHVTLPLAAFHGEELQGQRLALDVLTLQVARQEASGHHPVPRSDSGPSPTASSLFPEEAASAG